ncbi:hypothetical protein [Marichromatium bheemlicum]|uniref:ScoMcrA-like DNA sulfur-binding domain-containing protein n=1 Tax=Marichromatium bheemlicum TaxID=365339 RepID=A0ABX1I9H0_9GAMM|nr:hypothetical protein [Marichromatium bheemlicum]NKN33461.1 hypothetical protein [Marichromatium bheemlicum]
MDIVERFAAINAKPSGDTVKPHKPLLLLIALSRVWRRKPRLSPFTEYEEELKSFQDLFGNLVAIYPFGRLVSDGIWEVTDWELLTRNNSGDLVKADLVLKGALGGLTQEIYERILSDDALIKNITSNLLEKFLPVEFHEEIFRRLGFSKMRTVYRISESSVEATFSFSESGASEGQGEYGKSMKKDSEFIVYLNSLHSIRAIGANALAESQAINPFFGDLYEPFPLSKSLKDLLRDQTPRVVILSGHAGDGKSTVALDVYKALHRLDPKEPLKAPLREREEIPVGSHSVTIVKDMSELSGAQRQDWLREAFAEGSGSWLIVSNTGPGLSHQAPLIFDYANIRYNSKR